ncbi:MAG: tRNA lysidine(34) synthetase TilS [Bacteroidales bacterium]
MKPDHFIQFIDSGKLFGRDGKILLAVSGGIDSTVMADLFQKAQFDFAIAHCNFSLRGKESDKDARFVEKLAQKLNVPFFLKRFNTQEFASLHGISIQMAARELRYKWFEETRKENKYDYIATAHHLDDQVETFLINLIRGTGIAGLHGIPVKNGKVIRPMMFAGRTEIEQYAAKNQVDFRLDLSNNESKYLRNKIRHEVIPLLCSLNPEFRQGITETIGRICDFEMVGNQTLTTWCNEKLKPKGTNLTFDISHFLNLTPVEPYAWAMLAPFGFNQSQIANLIDNLEHADRQVFLSPTHRMVKERKSLNICIIDKEQDHSTRTFQVNHFSNKKTTTKPFPLVFEIFKNSDGFTIPATPGIACLDRSKLQFPLTLRKWQEGDLFYPLGMRGKKKLSDFFIDQKFSMSDKEDTWLLCTGNKIAWIIGHRIDHRFRVTSKTTEILSINKTGT